MDVKNTAERVLFRLKAEGPQTAQDIADAFSLSVMGAHKVLGGLSCAGLVAHEDVAEGRGRPRRVFKLTEAGHKRFPDRSAELNAELIGMIRDAYGQAGIDQLLATREARLKERYAQDEQVSLFDKVAAIAAKRASEGYMAHVETEADGALKLVEDHCPICSAAKACGGFCASELETFRTVLGPEAEVTREEHLMSGGRRCTYRIRAKDA